MSGFTITAGKEQVPVNLLMLATPSLAEVKRQLQNGLVFCGMIAGNCIGACVIERKSGTFEISSWVVDPYHRGKGYGKDLLYYAFDYLKALGAHSVDIGEANHNVDAFLSLQQMGFRVIGVLRNYYKDDDTFQENQIRRRDLIRYRYTL